MSSGHKTSHFGVFYIKMNLIFLIIALLTTFSTKVLALECPENTSILPCTCTTTSESHSTVHCIGEGVTQKRVDDLFESLWILNGPGILTISEFKLSSTSMTQLDLTPFLNTRIDQFYINANANLTWIGVTSSFHPAPLIASDRLIIEWNPNLSDQGLEDTLTFFGGISGLFFSYNNFSGSSSSSSGEFFDGLFNLTNLTQFYLQGNHISELRGGLFAGMSKIDYLRLQNVQLTTILEGAFWFDDPLLNSTLFLDLSLNLLTPDSFSVDSGLGNLGRPVFLDLWGNQIDTLPANIFETFLDAWEGNAINLDSNPIICDQRLLWIKNRRQDFEPFVTAPCSNDDGENVFTSSLIN